MADAIPALLPCPFCGGNARIRTEDELSCVVCDECPCAVGEHYDISAWPDHEFVSADEAFAAWNTRADRASRAPDAGVVEARKAALEEAANCAQAWQAPLSDWLVPDHMSADELVTARRTAKGIEDVIRALAEQDQGKERS